MPEYALYGLVIRSDCALDGLEAAPAGMPVDVDIALACARPSADEWRAATSYYLGPPEPNGVASVDVRHDPALGFWFRYADGAEFVLDRAATRINAWWPEASTLEDASVYLVGPVLGFALRLRGVLALHASAVLIDGRAVALIGPSGAGKSTTAAAFAAAGVPVLADDVVAVRLIDGVAMAYPSYRSLRLWDASEAMLFGTVGQLPKLTPTWEKRGLALGEIFPFHQVPAPLGDLFVLASRVDDTYAPRVEPLRGSEAFMAVLANTYANYLLDDQMRGEEMRALRAVLLDRRVQRLFPHDDPARLSGLVDCVRAAVRDASRA